MSGARFAVASNRGPVAHHEAADGTVEVKRGVGGLVSVLTSALQETGATWIAAAMTGADRRVARAGPMTLDMGGASGEVRLLDIDPEDYRAYYDEMSNRILWFCHHRLWDPPVAPSFGAREHAAWEAYVRVNTAFAEALAAGTPPGGVALTQDYHVSLVPALLRAARPDVAISHFWHIPFADPDQLRVLPDEWGTELLRGMLAADVIGFHSPRWAQNFLDCCRSILGAKVSGRTVRLDGHATRVQVNPIGASASLLRADAASERARAEGRALDRLTGDRRLVVRVDRTELSKNILRGFEAYERLLEDRADLRGRVVHLALLSPSRESVPEYKEYLARCIEAADRVNERFGEESWKPVELSVEDNFPRSLAAYGRYDVLVVNPIYDGMNLVAREGPILNKRSGALVLSRNAGAADELGEAAIVINPFDVTETAAAIGAALDMPPGERERRARRLRRLAQGTTPQRWLARQMRALGR